MLTIYIHLPTAGRNATRAMGRALFAFPTKVGTEGIAGVRQDLDVSHRFPENDGDQGGEI